jgi:hypothetical protein
VDGKSGAAPALCGTARTARPRPGGLFGACKSTIPVSTGSFFPAQRHFSFIDRSALGEILAIEIGRSHRDERLS